MLDKQPLFVIWLNKAEQVSSLFLFRNTKRKPVPIFYRGNFKTRQNRHTGESLCPEPSENTGFRLMPE